ncbi:TOMM precursor leader peptide-binding protein, partial [Streptomyces sp. 900105245]
LDLRAQPVAPRLVDDGRLPVPRLGVREVRARTRQIALVDHPLEHLASGTPHLYAGVVEGTGVVGPLVLPGESGCAGCLHEDRTDRDPVWPRLISQWGSGRARRIGACDLTLATAVAGLAAAHALTFLDGGAPAATGARWEVSAPGLTWHSRPVRPHPACGCGAAERGRESGKTEHFSTDGRPRATMAVQRPSAKRRSEAGAARPTGTWRAHV